MWGAASLRTPALRSLPRWCWPVAAASWAAAFFFSRGRGSGSGRKEKREPFPGAKFKSEKQKTALLIYTIRCRPRGKLTYNRNKKASNCVKSQIPRPRHPSRVPPTAGVATALFCGFRLLLSCCCCGRLLCPSVGAIAPTPAYNRRYARSKSAHNSAVICNSRPQGIRHLSFTGTASPDSGSARAARERRPSALSRAAFGHRAGLSQPGTRSRPARRGAGVSGSAGRRPRTLLRGHGLLQSRAAHTPQPPPIPTQ